MRVILLIAALIFSTLLFGCVASTGVIPAGPDTYTITTDSRIGRERAITVKTIQDAKAYCASSGKKMRTVRPPSISSRRNFFGNEITTYNLTFRCIATGDKD